MPIDKLFNHPNAGTALTGALSGAAGGALVSAFTNKKSAKKLLKGAGLVAVGGLAWQAYKTYRGDTKQATADLSEKQFEAAVAPEGGASLLVLQAMIAAAHADGHLTANEQQRIWQHALETGLPAEQLDSLQVQLGSPLSIDHLVTGCKDMATRIEVYTASLLVIEADCAAGNTYLRDLAARLTLPGPLVATLHQQCDHPMHSAPDQGLHQTA